MHAAGKRRKFKGPGLGIHPLRQSPPGGRPIRLGAESRPENRIARLTRLVRHNTRASMPSHPTLAAAVIAIATLGFSACKTVYSDTFAYRKSSFQAPPEKQVDIAAPPASVMPLEGAAPGGIVPGAPEAIPGVPGMPGAAPDSGIPGVPGAAPAPAPGAPAIPGLN
jgi:hypothetical protein